MLTQEWYNALYTSTHSLCFYGMMSSSWYISEHRQKPISLYSHQNTFSAKLHLSMIILPTTGHHTGSSVHITVHPLLSTQMPSQQTRTVALAKQVRHPVAHSPKDKHMHFYICGHPLSTNLTYAHTHTQRHPSIDKKMCISNEQHYN